MRAWWLLPFLTSLGSGVWMLFALFVIGQVTIINVAVACAFAVIPYCLVKSLLAMSGEMDEQVVTQTKLLASIANDLASYRPDLHSVPLDGSVSVSD
jgi:hypothetical protein